jgi:aminoglycoside 6'-N-acetyltransferase
MNTDCGTTIRPVDSSDYGLLVHWFGNKEFVEWWGGTPKSPAEVVEKYLGGRSSVHSFIVEHNGEPCGYMQSWKTNDWEGGIDIILLPEKKGLGIGPRAILRLTEQLRNQGWTRIIVDPQSQNLSAIRACEKVGFQREHHTDDRIIMVFDPDRTPKRVEL